MKIVIAMDSFKGTFTAEESCQIVADAIRKYHSDIEIILKPMADGGSGTAAAMIKAKNGRWLVEEVTGPLPDMKVSAGFAWFEKDKTALVEMAAASGLELLKKEQMNPLKTFGFPRGFFF